jgi:hypothetical protein
VRFIPTGRKRGNKPLDKTSGRWLNLKEGEMDVERGSPKVSPGGYWQMPGPMRKTQDKSSDAAGLKRRGRGGKGRRDVKNEDRTGYVHENKQHDDILSIEKPIFLHHCTRLA